VKNPIGRGRLHALLEDGVMDRSPSSAASVRERVAGGAALRLIEDLLELARAQSGELDVRHEP